MAVKPRIKLSDASSSLAERAYKAVRTAIEEGQFGAGERISEFKVADWLNISRTPAREGLLRLESEGVLISHPRRGLVVASIDRDFLKELFIAREILEGAAARLAARNASGPEIDEINRLVDKQRALAPDDLNAMYEENKVFHRTIHRASHNRFVAKFLQSLVDVVTSDRRVSTLSYQGRSEAVLKEHGEIAAAITDRDGEKAALLAADHIRMAYVARVALTTEDGEPR
jgi:DNA-binding GntR family transcriptional regulator